MALNQKGKRPTSRSGQTLVEYIFVFPIFFVIVVFTIQLSIIAHTNTMTQLASFFAARQYAISADEKTAKLVASHYMFKLDYYGQVEPFATDGWSVDISADDSKKGIGSPATATVNAKLELLDFPLIYKFFPDSKKADNTTKHIPQWGTYHDSEYISSSASTRTFLE